HPGGGGPVDPKPYVDAWLASALANVPNLLAAYLPPAAAGAQNQAAAAGVDGVFDAPAVPARSQLLWASSASPAGGALQVASAEATEAARSVDWQAESRRHAAEVLAWQESDAAAKAMVTPLVPAPLRSILGLAPASPAGP